MKVPFEISIAFFIYIGALAYAIYQAYKYGQSEYILLFPREQTKTVTIEIIF